MGSVEALSPCPCACASLRLRLRACVHECVHARVRVDASRRACEQAVLAGESERRRERGI
eukprot:6204009-Pleurochrysis_carterae.AAC.1